MKGSVLQLAAFGGNPLFAQPIHVGQPGLPSPEQLLADFGEVLKSGQLTNHGPQVRLFEQTVAQICDVRHCVATCNATTALQIAARALRLQGEVIVPALTFIATAHAMEWIGLTPVFADVCPQTHTLDPASVEACISSKTSAIVPVHLWGNTCDIESLSHIARRHSLRIVFDSSHAFGCQHLGRPVGSFGDAEVFSFHATKFVSSIEGGAIVTNCDELAERCRLQRAFGISGLTEISDAGINGKMHELSAAAGLHSLNCLPEILGANRRNRQLYDRAVQQMHGIQLLECPKHTASNLQYVVALIDEPRLGLSRDHLVALLRSEGVFARSYFVPGCHRAAPYCEAPVDVHQRTPLPVTEHLLQTVLQLPTGFAVSADDVMRICGLIAYICQNATEIRRQLVLRLGRIRPHEADPGGTREITLREAG